MIIIQL